VRVHVVDEHNQPAASKVHRERRCHLVFGRDAVQPHHHVSRRHFAVDNLPVVVALDAYLELRSLLWRAC
jgi:hypothetical protein